MITRAAVVTAAAMVTETEVAVDLLVMEAEEIIMKIREMASTIGAVIGANEGIEAKSTALSVRIPWWDLVTSPSPTRETPLGLFIPSRICQSVHIPRFRGVKY